MCCRRHGPWLQVERDRITALAKEHDIDLGEGLDLGAKLREMIYSTTHIMRSVDDEVQELDRASSSLALSLSPKK